MAKLILDGDARGAVRATADLGKAFDQTKGVVQATGKEMKALEKAAGDIVKKNEGPQQQYNRQIQELGRLMRAGVLDFKQAEVAAMRYGTQLDRAGKSGFSAFGSSALSALGSYVTGLASVAGAVALIRSEWDAVVDRQRKVTLTQLTAADARDVLKRNVFNLPDAQRGDVLARADKLAATTKLPQSVIDNALAQAISARGGNVQEALTFTQYASRFTRDPESIGEFAGALGDIANAIGTKNPQQALGYLGITSQQARPTDLRQVARNLPKLTQAVRGSGGDPRYGGALFAGLTVGAADPMGDISRTAGIRLVDRVGSFFKGDTRGYLADQVDSFDEQFQTLLNNKKLAGQFLDKNTFEAGAQPAIRALLLDRQSAARRSFESAYGAIGTPTEQLAAGARGVEFLAGGKLAGVRRAEDTVKSSMERFQLSRTAEFSPERREEIRELSRATKGEPSFIHSMTFAGRTGPTLDLHEAIEELTHALENGPGKISPLYDAEAVKTAENLLAELRDLAREQRNLLNSLNDKTRSVPVPGGRQE